MLGSHKEMLSVFLMPAADLPVSGCTAGLDCCLTDWLVSRREEKLTGLMTFCGYHILVEMLNCFSVEVNASMEKSVGLILHTKYNFL